MTRRRRTQLVLAALGLAALVLAGIAATRGDERGAAADRAPPPRDLAAVVDRRDEAATAPDPRGRSLFPDASCVAPTRLANDGPSPRCVLSFGRVVTALGLGGGLAITSLAHGATVGWTLPGATAGLLFEPLPAEAEARAILVEPERGRASFAVGAEIWRYDTSSGRRIERSDGPGGMIEALAASRDGSRVGVVTAADGRARLLGGDGSVLRSLPTAERALHVAVDPRGERAAVATEAGAVAIFDLESDAAPPILVRPNAQPASGLAFAGDRLVVAGSDGAMRSFDPRDGREIAAASAGSPLLRLAISEDGRLAATAAADRVIRVHVLPGGEVVAELRWHQAGIGALGFGAGPTLVSADNDGELAVWDLEPSGRPRPR
jgi:hypothetical protein